MLWLLLTHSCLCFLFWFIQSTIYFLLKSPVPCVLLRNSKVSWLNCRVSQKKVYDRIFEVPRVPKNVKKCPEHPKVPKMARKCPELPNLKKFYYELFFGTPCIVDIMALTSSVVQASAINAEHMVKDSRLPRFHQWTHHCSQARGCCRPKSQRLLTLPRSCSSATLLFSLTLNFFSYMHIAP